MRSIRNWTSSRAHRQAAGPGRHTVVGRPHRGQAAYTLIEALVSVAITSIVVVGLLGGVMTALKSSALQRRAATSEVVLSNFSEAFTDVPYVACATNQDYNDAVDAVATPDGFEVAVTNVLYWNQGSKNPATFAENCANADADTGLQKIEYSVTADTDDGPEVRKHSILKRFNGTLSDLYEQVPAGAVRCNVTADRDTFLDKADTGANHGREVSMDVAGIAGSERQGLVHFDLDPENAKCDNGDGIPVGMSVRSVEMRLYTWQVTGSPDCALACKHTLQRVTEDWGEDTATWATPPAVDKTSAGTVPFKHGTGSGDYSPRHQVITDGNLLSQVSLYYQVPLVNFGWSIQQDCGPSKADCEASAPGFRMRTREWPTASQRPTLSIVFQPNNDSGMQLQNVRYDTCASIKNGGIGGNRAIVSLGCAGRPDQLWIHTPGTAAGEGQFETETGRDCIQPVGTNTEIRGCDNRAIAQRWKIDGRAIRSQNDTNLCLAATSEHLGSNVGVEVCNDKPEQQWIFGPPPVSFPSSAIRLTALDASGRPTGSCADVDVSRGMTPYDRFDPYESRSAQTFPCLGPTRLAQQWNLAPDGRLVNRQFPAACLGYLRNAVAVEQCAEGSGQLWAIEGSQIRNIHDGRCVEWGDGRKILLLQPCNSNRPRQDWSVDPADSAALITPVQLRNNKNGDCLEPDGPVTDKRWMWTYECGGLDRPAQAFVHANTDELVSLANPAMCLTRTVDNQRAMRNCSPIDGNKSRAQQWKNTELSQLQSLETNECVQGNGNLQRLTLAGCATSVDNIDPGQQWSLEELGTTTSVLREMRNLDSGSCADLRINVNAIVWPCSGASRAIQGVLLAKVGNEYEVRSAANPGQCLDVQGGGAEDAAVRPINCNYGPFQRWTLSEDGQLKTSSPGGRCLQGGLDNAPLAMRTCNPDAGSNAAQRWEFEDATDTRELRQIRNVESGSCLDVLGTVTQGQAYTGVPCSGEDRPNQAFVQLNNGAFASAASDTNLCIDGGGGNGDVVLPWTCKNPAQNQGWKDEGSLFKHVSSGQCAEFNPGSSTASVQRCNTGSPYLAWAVEDVAGTPSSTLQFRNADNGCLDIEGATRAGYSDNDRLVVMPCLGSARTNQSFRLMSNGMIRSTGTPGQCLDAASSAREKRPVLYTCDTNKDDQRWKVEGGQLTNVTKAGVSRETCIQGGLDGVQATMQTCLTSSDQQWVMEAHGLNTRPDAVGRLRTTGDNLCLETEGLQGGQSLRMLGGPCVAADKPQQRFVRLNSGQFRPVANLGFCLNANGNGDGAIPNTIVCPIGSTNTALEWVIDSNGWLSSANSQLCIEAPGPGWFARQRGCAVGPIKANQQWVFEPEGGL